MRNLTGAFHRQRPAGGGGRVRQGPLGEMSADERRWCAGALIAEVGRYGDKHHSVSALASSADSDSIAAPLPAKDPRDDPGNRRSWRRWPNRSHTLSGRVHQCRKRCGGAPRTKTPRSGAAVRGAVAMLSNHLARNGQRRPREGRAPAPGRPEGKQDAPELARRALADGSIDVETELEDLDIASRRGRDSVSIMHMLGRAPDIPVTEWFVAKMGRAVVDTWTGEREVIGGPNYEFRSNATDGLAEIILSLPRTILDYCLPFLDAVDTRPDRVASFVRSLVAHMDGPSVGRPFWDVWRAFADQTIRAPWIPDTVSADYKGAELVRCMVFDMEWLKGPHWEYLAGHEERVCGFVDSLPPTPHVLASFARYLYASGAGIQPGPIEGGSRPPAGRRSGRDARQRRYGLLSSACASEVRLRDACNAEEGSRLTERHITDTGSACGCGLACRIQYARRLCNTERLHVIAPRGPQRGLGRWGCA